MRTVIATSMRRVLPADPRQRWPIVSCVGALTFMTLILLSTLPHRLF
jgi:hypothetical protein